MNTPLPKLRSIETFPVDVANEPLVFLHLLRNVPGRLLCCDRTRDDGARALVTFASVAFDQV